MPQNPTNIQQNDSIEMLSLGRLGKFKKRQKAHKNYKMTERHTITQQLLKNHSERQILSKSGENHYNLKNNSKKVIGGNQRQKMFKNTIDLLKKQNKRDKQNTRKTKKLPIGQSFQGNQGSSFDEDA